MIKKYTLERLSNKDKVIVNDLNRWCILNWINYESLMETYTSGKTFAISKLTGDTYKLIEIADDLGI
tara:strand:- start:243 stop:443 length:201 start_codon:yes stop_codon:yes gene_type:complete